MNTGFEGARRRYDTCQFRGQTLSSGPTLWMQESPIQPSYQGGISIMLPGVGSQLDPDDMLGLAHLLEHVICGSTQFGGVSGLIDHIASKGGSLVARTDIGGMRFDVRMHQNELEHVLDILAELLLMPTFSKETVDNEKAVISEKEWKSYFSLTDRFAWRAMRESFFAGQPLSKESIGTLEGIANVTIDALQEFFDTYFHAGNMHMVCYGSFSEIPDAVSCIEDRFNEVPQAATLKPPANSAHKGPRSLNIEGLQRDWLFLGRQIESNITLRDRSALRLLVQALGGGTSTLFKELRRNGWVYEKGLCSFWEYAQANILLLNCPVDAKHAKEVTELFRDTLSGLEEDHVARLQAAGQQRRSQLFTGPINVVGDIVDELVIFGEPLSYSRWHKVADEVTWEDVLRWRDYLCQSEMFELVVSSA